MICRYCQTENPNQARYCMNCGRALAARCTNCQTELPSQARFCMHCGQPVIAISPADENRLARLAAAAPAPLVEKVRASETLAGERRVVTALLVDVVGSTALSTHIDPENWATIMNGLFDRIAPIIYRYEGSIARLLGDSLLAFFGAPLAHEDDPVRAVRAGLEAMQAANQYADEINALFNVEFLLRACINTGPIVLGALGEDLQYQYTAVGSVVNLVSRLKFAAQPKSVLISEYTQRFAEPYFDLEEQTAIQVKGIQQPVRVFQVIRVKEQPGRLRGIRGLYSPMVGRQDELSILMHQCEAVRAGLGRAVLLIGEPGMGKTRLLAEWKTLVSTSKEFVTQQTLPLWSEGRGLSYGQGTAYHLIADWLHNLISANDPGKQVDPNQALMDLIQESMAAQVNEVYPFLAHLMGIRLVPDAQTAIDQLDPEALLARYLSSLRQLILALTSQNPLIIILEDLHWADPSSADLFSQLLPLTSETAFLLCMVTRQEQESAGWRLVGEAREHLGSRLTTINLSALTDAESRQLVSNLLEVEALPEHVRTTILRKSEGNPFFVEEVIRMLIERGVIIQRDGGWFAEKEINEVEIPDNLQGLLLARIDRLPEEVRDTLRIAAVIGRQFPLRVLAEVLASRENL